MKEEKRKTQITIFTVLEVTTLIDCKEERNYATVKNKRMKGGFYIQ
jgi:hypothetical protein